MTKVRLLLSLVLFFSLSWFFGGLYWVNNFSSNNTINLLAGFGMVLGPILFLASVLTMVFSLFRISESSDGRLNYEPTNPHWRLLKKCFNVKGKLSLCSAYWLTVLLVFITSLFSGVTVLFSYVIMTQGMWKFLSGFKILLPLLAFLGSVFVPAFLHHYFKHEKVKVFFLYLVGAVLLGWVVILPFYSFVYKDGLTFTAAMAKYFLEIGKLALMMIPICIALGLFLLLAKYVSSISQDSLLKRLFTAFKNNLCPILYEKSDAAGK